MIVLCLEIEKNMLVILVIYENNQILNINSFARCLEVVAWSTSISFPSASNPLLCSFLTDSGLGHMTHAGKITTVRQGDSKDAWVEQLFCWCSENLQHSGKPRLPRSGWRTHSLPASPSAEPGSSYKTPKTVLFPGYTTSILRSSSMERLESGPHRSSSLVLPWFPRGRMRQ